MSPLRSSSLRRVTVTVLAMVAAAAMTATPGFGAAKKTSTRKAKPKAPVTTTTAVAPSTTTTSTTAAPATTAATTTTAKPAASLAWTACGQYQCASLSVPLDYKNPTGPKITLALERLAASDRLGSLLINPGGPGGSGIRFLHQAGAKLLTAEARSRYDVIGFDPRGVGKSTPLPCSSAQDRGARADADFVRAIAAACQNRAPAQVAATTTENTALDLEEIRKALGEPKLNFLGVSYGTYLGLVYADHFPSNVGRFVIDSAVDPTIRALALNVGQQAQYEANLKGLMGACTATCAFADPDPYGRVQRLLQRVENYPLRSSKVWAGNRYNLELFIRALPTRPGGYERLMTLLNEWDHNDSSSISYTVAFLDDRLPDPSDFDDAIDADSVYFAVACSEGFHPSASPDFATFGVQLKAAAPSFTATADARVGGPVCEWWGKATETRFQPTAKPGQPPMLFIGETGDSVTPFGWTEAVSKRWPGSALLKVVGFAHGATPVSTCAASAVSDFLLKGALPAAGTVCNS